MRSSIAPLRQYHPQGLRCADDGGQAICTARAGDDAQTDFGHPKDGVGGEIAQVCAESEFEPATEGVACDAGDDGDGECGDAVEGGAEGGQEGGYFLFGHSFPLF